MKAADVKEYENLIGKEIKWFNEKDEYVGLIADIDYYIGITIVDKENTSDNLICLEGPCSTLWKERNKVVLSMRGEKRYKKNYDSIFLEAIKMIEKGFFNAEKITNMYEYSTGTIDNPIQCAFNQ